jgi:hypothetical protein
MTYFEIVTIINKFNFMWFNNLKFMERRKYFFLQYLLCCPFFSLLDFGLRGGTPLFPITTPTPTPHAQMTGASVALRCFERNNIFPMPTTEL